MKTLARRLLAAAAAGSALMLACGAAQAEIIGGVEFPDGAASFADKVTSYLPPIPGPSAPHQGPDNSLGAPNYAGVNSCASTASCSFVSLGDGGTLIVEFVDNRLTGSGSSADDLWIFEVGPDVEDTFVWISKDGIVWVDVGKVFGSTRGIDIDSFGWGISDQFRFVKLTDDTNEGGQGSGGTVGADIDAVGAISSVAAPVPEPETWAMFLFGAMAVALQRRRALKARA
ncbi:MAG: PEP-CTERM sorting domain-containing protein [Burkholderiales bacterium]|nr:PEP-CTERM sorting domain-containing protein [Burkholderiales bacterium]